ncbi:lrgA family protein [Bordetella holmesii 70147]|nr:lrgA family protein [Bordetella holmesii 70147]
MFSRSWTLGRSYLRRSRLMQIGVIASFAWAGQALAQWGNLPVPGSVLGLTMVLLLLASGVMRVNHIRRGASWLLAEMLLFFVPAVLADVVALVFWPLATVMAYVCARAVYRRRGYWWSSTLVMAPALLLALALCLHAGYADYMRGSHWLMAMLSPVIVSFALPLYQERALIRRYWPILLVGVTVGSTIAGVSAWLLASWLDLPAEVRMSLVPRSVATPFAMTLSSKLGESLI